MFCLRRLWQGFYQTAKDEPRCLDTNGIPTNILQVLYGELASGIVVLTILHWFDILSRCDGIPETFSCKSLPLAFHRTAQRLTAVYVFCESPLTLHLLYLPFVYRLHNHNPPTYETGSTRKFFLGRTDTIRSASITSSEFAKSMVSPNKTVSCCTLIFCGRRFLLEKEIKIISAIQAYITMPIFIGEVLQSLKKRVIRDA